MTKPQILSEILKLSVDERIDLVQEVWDSIVGTPEMENAELSPEVAAELDRRLKDHDQNPDEGISWAELKQRLLASR